MPDFLRLSRIARREAGISGDGPSSTVSQTGEMERIVAWVNMAWMAIQMEHPNWLWMRASATVATSTNDNSYTPSEFSTTNFGRWYPDSFRIYITATGQSDEQHLIHMPYDQWRDLYDFGNNSTNSGRPVHFSIGPDQSIKLGPKPDATGYTVKGDYQKEPTEMAADGDIPGMPDEFHIMIVWKALMYYAAYESAPEVYQSAEKEYKRMLSKLRLNQLPAMLFPGPLV